MEKYKFNQDLNEALITAVVKGCKALIQLVICDAKEANGEEYVKSSNAEEIDFDEISSVEIAFLILIRPLHGASLIVLPHT